MQKKLQQRLKIGDVAKKTKEPGKKVSSFFWVGCNVITGSILDSKVHRWTQSYSHEWLNEIVMMISMDLTSMFTLSRKRNNIRRFHNTGGNKIDQRSLDTYKSKTICFTGGQGSFRRGKRGQKKYREFLGTFWKRLSRQTGWNM